MCTYKGDIIHQDIVYMNTKIRRTETRPSYVGSQLQSRYVGVTRDTRDFVSLLRRLQEVSYVDLTMKQFVEEP